jgi:hypothetical protein
LEYEVRNVVNDVVTSDTLYLMQINPDNSSTSTVLSATTQNETQYPGNIIPDEQGGVLATWTISPARGTLPLYPYQAVDVSAGVVGTPYNLPFSPQTVSFGQSPTPVLGENGVAFAGGSTTATINGIQTAVDQIASFNLSSGATNWTYQAAQGNHLSIIEATFGNGLAAKSTDQNGIDTVLLFGSSGAQSQAFRRSLTSGMKWMAQGQPTLSGFSNMDYSSNGWWVGTSGGAAAAVLGSVIQSAMSSYAHSLAV